MLALLHTSPLHVPVFDALRDVEAPGLPLRHVVREDLLAAARREGPAAVAREVAELVAEAARGGAGAVLCTCSTIGAVAEEAGARAGTAVLRVDRPTAAAAVAAGDRVTVVAALASTVGPTAALVREEAARAGREVTVRCLVADGAWEFFERGDQEAFLERVARTLREADAAGGTDVALLAQASMAAAADRVAPSFPVLTTPRTGLRAAARLAPGVHPTTDTGT